MNDFISIIVFSIPGLLVYFWLQSFGLNPTVKHTTTEVAAISVLFWIPTVLLAVTTYDIAYALVDLIISAIGWDWSGLGLKSIKNLKDIEDHATNLLFILYFFVLSLVFSFIVARVWSQIIFERVLKSVNDVRIKRKLAKLEDTTSVWDAFFTKLDEKKEETLVVEVYKVDKPGEEKIVGSVTKMSRPYEADKALVLENVVNNSESHKYFEYEVKRSYIDVKSGLVVSELNTTKPTKHVDDFTSLLAVPEAEQLDE